MKILAMAEHKGLMITVLALLLGAGGLRAEDAMTDTDITEAVRTRLVLDQAVSSDSIEVTTNIGIVSLDGSVSNVLARRRAETLAGTVRGVRGIINLISVDPPRLPDDTLETHVEQALLWEPALEGLEITVSADDGEIALDGTVDSWQERELAETTTAGIRGVSSISNDIEVVFGSERSDSELREEIEQALRGNAYVDEYMVRVSVEEGDVKLSGTVGSMAEKNMATLEAWVYGVELVNNLDLRVDPAYREGAERETRIVEMSDEELEEAVFDTYLYDPRVNPLNLDIEVMEGTVVISGTVDNLMASRVAVSDARNVMGALQVLDSIEVVTEDRPDQEIVSSVEDALARDAYVNGYDIQVTVEDGIVYLNGTVDSYFKKTRSEDLASGRRGVTGVRNLLEVDGPDYRAYDPYVDEWYLYDYGWYNPSTMNIGSGMTDYEIAQSIREQLFWSPFLDSDDIDVEVNGGVAVLTGTVDTWTESEAAETSALRGGAEAVQNELIVSYGTGYMEP